MGVLILPPVRGASKQGGAQPHTVRGVIFFVVWGGLNKPPAVPAPPPAHLPSKRRGLRYTSEAELTDTLTAAETAPLQQQKADHVRRLRKAEASAGTANGDAVACGGRGASRAQRATSAEQRERIT